MDQELKREILLDNYSNPFHKETKDGFLKANANNISCIDDINVFIKIEDNKIVDAYFDGEACAISTASTSIMIKKIIGMTIKEARKYIENFDNMVNEKEYDKENMDEALAFDEIYKLEVSDFFFRYSLSHGFPHDRNNLRSPDVPAGLCHKAFHYPQRDNHTS